MYHTQLENGLIQTDLQTDLVFITDGFLITDEITDGFCPSVKAPSKIIYRRIFFRRKITDGFLLVTDGFSLCKFSLHFLKATNLQTDFSSVITDRFFKL